MPFTSGFQIKENKVIKLEVTINPKYESNKCCTEFNMTCATQHHSKITNDKQFGRIICDIKVELYRENRKELKYATITIRDVGIFEAPSEMSRDDFDRMLHLNGLTTLLPLIRGIVFNISATLNLQTSVLIPNINVTKIEWEKLESTNEP